MTSSKEAARNSVYRGGSQLVAEEELPPDGNEQIEEPALPEGYRHIRSVTEVLLEFADRKFTR